MKLFVYNSKRDKVYLNVEAESRTELMSQIGGESFTVGGEVYSVDNVIAENNSNSTTTGAFVGGLVGVLGGPFGIVIGSVVGGLIGNGSDDHETKKVNEFNSIL